MAQPRRKPHVGAGGFDVTVETVIGRVELDASGHHTPEEVAFLMIASSDHTGTFRFPAADGGTVEVTVTHREAT